MILSIIILGLIKFIYWKPYVNMLIIHEMWGNIYGRGENK